MAQVAITGNVGKTPELRQAGQSQVLKFSVADTEYIYSKEGEAPSQWFNVEVWGKQAERLSSFLSSGVKVTAYGQLVQRPYEGKNGKGVSMELRDARVSVLTKKQAEATSGSSGFSEDIPF